MTRPWAEGDDPAYEPDWAAIADARAEATYDEPWGLDQFERHLDRMGEGR